MEITSEMTSVGKFVALKNLCDANGEITNPPSIRIGYGYQWYVHVPFMFTEGKGAMEGSGVPHSATPELAISHLWRRIEEMPDTEYITFDNDIPFYYRWGGTCWAMIPKKAAMAKASAKSVR